MKRLLRSPGSRIVHGPLTVLTLAALITSSSIARADGVSFVDALSSVTDGVERDDGVDGRERESWSLDPSAGVVSSFAPRALLVPTALLAGIGLAPSGVAATESSGAKASVAAPVDPAAPSTAGAPPQGDDGASTRIAGYLAGGVGIAGLALFAVAGLGAKNAFDKLESECGTSRCDDVGHRSNIEEGRMLQTAANIGLAVGVVGVGLGATLIVIGRRPLEDKPADKAEVAIVGGPGAISLRGSF